MTKEIHVVPFLDWMPYTSINICFTKNSKHINLHKNEKIVGFTNRSGHIQKDFLTGDNLSIIKSFSGEFEAYIISGDSLKGTLIRVYIC